MPVADAAAGDPYPPIECIECEYVFSTSTVEDLHGGAPETIDTVDREIRDASRHAMIREFSMSVAHNFRLRSIDRKILKND